MKIITVWDQGEILGQIVANDDETESITKAITEALSEDAQEFIGVQVHAPDSLEDILSLVSE